MTPEVPAFRRLKSIEYPTNPASGDWLPVGDIDHAVDALLTDLGAVRPAGIVRIFTGEANPAVYNDERFLQAVQDITHTKQAKIRAITGPIVVVGPDGWNGLLRLRAEGFLDALYHRCSHGDLQHFRLVETDVGYSYYLEQYHEPLAPTKHCYFANIAPIEPNTVQRMAENAATVFDGIAASLPESSKPNPGGLPFLATAVGLRRLLEQAEESKLVFQRLSPRTLLSLPDAPLVLRISR